MTTAAGFSLAPRLREGPRIPRRGFAGRLLWKVRA